MSLCDEGLVLSFRDFGCTWNILGQIYIYIYGPLVSVSILALQLRSLPIEYLNSNKIVPIEHEL